MTEEVALYVEHEVKYTNKDPIPVRDVVASLLALEKISGQFLPRTLKALTDAEVKRAEILVEGFEHGSLKEKVLIKLVFGSEEKLDQFLDALHQGKVKDAWEMLPGGHRVRIGLVGATIAVLLALGVSYVLHDDDKQPLQPVNVIMIGGEEFNRNPQEVVEIVRTAVGSDRKKLAQETANFLAPAKHDPNGSVVLDGSANLTIPAKIVQAMPREVAAEPHESNIPYKDVDVEIRATDRDSSARGWACVVRDLFDRRVKLVLGEGVEAHGLANRFHVRADVVVTERPDSRTGQLVPVQVTIQRIIPDDA